MHKKWKYYTLTVFFANIFAVIGCTSDETKARNQLHKLGYEFSGQGLSKAILNKDRFAINQFLGAKVDPNITNNGIPVLASASVIADEETAFALLKRDANVKQRFAFNEKKEMTILHLAAIGDSSKITEALIKAGAEVNAKNNEGNTPILFAALQGKMQNVQLFVKYGAVGDVHLSSFPPTFGAAGFRMMALAAGTQDHMDVESFLQTVANKTMDCSSPNNVPKNHSDILKSCERACDEGVSFACGRAGSELFSTAEEKAKKQPITSADERNKIQNEPDVISAFKFFEKGCTLKDLSVCSNIGRLASSEYIIKLQQECDHGSVFSCGHYASAIERATSRGKAAREASQRGCKGGDTFSCLLLALSYVKSAKTGNLRDPMFFKANPYFVRACNEGWSAGCELMGK